MKGFIKISAAAVAVGIAATLAGCSGCASCAGCSGNAVNTAVTNSNWYTGTSYKGIQPSFVIDGEHPEYTPEEIVYDVSFDNSAANNSHYTVDYKDGSYSTLFFATRYDWNASTDEYKSDNSELVYCFRSEFTASVKYALKTGGESEWFSDSIVTESYFRAASRNLQPVYSKQVIKTTSPKSKSPKTLEEAYERVDVVYENFYSPDCKEVTSVTTHTGKESETEFYSLKKLKNSLFDNSSLYIAVRSMKLSADYSQTVSLFIPEGGVSSYTISGNNTALGNEERKAVSTALADKGLYTPKTTSDENGNPVEDAGVNTVAMNINYTGGNLVGTTQTVWYAAIEDTENNVSRATMLKLSVPLSYQLGVINYTLKEVRSTLWSGN